MAATDIGRKFVAVEETENGRFVLAVTRFGNQTTHKDRFGVTYRSANDAYEAAEILRGVVRSAAQSAVKAASKRARRRVTKPAKAKITAE